MARILRFLLFLYQKYLSGVHYGRCRYFPSCSFYADEAIYRHGSIYGVFLALKRLIRCNQWFPGGYDPVP